MLVVLVLVLVRLLMMGVRVVRVGRVRLLGCRLREGLRWWGLECLCGGSLGGRGGVMSLMIVSVFFFG